MRKVGLVFALTCLAAPAAVAVAGRAWLERMISSADAIVLGEVLSVEGPDGGQRLATAKVIKTYKGAVGERVRFDASPTWSCDSSSAEAGEHALLFLRRTKSGDRFALAEDGRGRMVVRDVDGGKFLEPILIDLPVDVRLAKHLDADGGWFIKRELASFDDVIGYVENGRLLASPSTTTKPRYSLSTRCEDAGTPRRSPFAQVPECLVWRDAAELQCRFSDDDHSIAHCSRRAQGARPTPFLQPSADLWCELDKAPSAEPLSCKNHLSW